MIAPITFVKLDGKRVCIDAYDVCSIDEKGEGETEVTWTSIHKTHVFVTSQNFQDIIDACLVACKSADPTTEGEEWRNGYNDKDT